MADPGLPRGGGANSPGGRQHTILPNFPKNCMKLTEFRPPGRGGARPKFYYVDPPLFILPIITFALQQTFFAINIQGVEGICPICFIIMPINRLAFPSLLKATKILRPKSVEFFCCLSNLLWPQRLLFLFVNGPLMKLIHYFLSASGLQKWNWSLTFAINQ